MENITDFNKNIAVLYEKDSGVDKSVAIRNLLDCDDIGLEIVKRFVVDRANRVSVRLLALVELWRRSEDYKSWVISIIEQEEEYLFLQQDFLAFLVDSNDDNWLEKLTHSPNDTLKSQAASVFSNKLNSQITQLRESLDPYQQSLDNETQKLQRLTTRLETEVAEEKRLYSEIEIIKERITRVEERKQSLNQDIATQTSAVGEHQAAFEQVQGEQKHKIQELQQKIQVLSRLISTEETTISTRELNLV